jgi:two-component system CheB/CheR fusion protein
MQPTPDDPIDGLSIESGDGAARAPVAAGLFPVIGIGGSSGGLEASRKVLEALPAKPGMAFILVLHLDPTHKSMMVDLLAGHTAMTVQQAANGMPIEPDHLFVIAPGTYLGVENGALRLLPPTAPHGARLPFDFLLNALAAAFGKRAGAVILSGNGADGSLGLLAVKAAGGLVVAQDPADAGYDGMPRSAIATGKVDLVLLSTEIADALAQFAQSGVPGLAGERTAPPHWLSVIVDLLRNRTPHDFRLYKPGTLQRRVERRMSMIGIEAEEADRYIGILRQNAVELDLLAKDLLINVTSFFRDPKVFDILAHEVIPDLIRNQAEDRPLRVWIAGCSTGEETYSLAMLFREEIAKAERRLNLQFFASDVDPDAVVIAREGLYPDSIEAEVSPARLARFFTKESRGYRILPDLRSLVVFTVQDLLADPPFSRLDLVSCRNLLIYLQPEAQAQAIALFHFALREGGILLLGGAETIGAADNHFRLLSKTARIYRHIGRSRPGDLAFSLGAGMRGLIRHGQGEPAARPSALSELCRRIVMENYAPAAVLINQRNEYLYAIGPTDRYLRVAPGLPTRDLLAMARPPLRNRLRSAIDQARRSNQRITVAGGRTDPGPEGQAFSIAVHPLVHEGQELSLVCFIDEALRPRERPRTPEDAPRIAELEQELEATRAELQAAIRSLDMSSEEQIAINEEALSVNEEYQSTNEELLTSKEELQSLNEELTALNSQLQETLERQRTTASDLQNVLYSTDVATLFLDRALHIRFFTPATRALFHVIATDIGRPLADLAAVTTDAALLDDARAVLGRALPIEREIRTESGAWFNRRVLPYRARDDEVAGVVITFTDVTERKEAARALEAAKREAELANAAKSRFLAVASHDLRQPLQTFALLQGLLAKSITDERSQRLLARLDETLGAMTGMLNTLLDINQIEAGTISSVILRFPIQEILGRLTEEFAFHAQGKGLVLRSVPCRHAIDSDPRLLEQMIRNLLSNAMKYTKQGKILLGCRLRQGRLSVEVWDTGIGIPEVELQAIFEEYHQLGKAARETNLGLGLGLAIVRRLGRLLGHPVSVRSWPGKGAVFAIEIALPEDVSVRGRADASAELPAPEAAAHRTGVVLIVEDDPEVRELLEMLLENDGHRAITAADGRAALALVTAGAVRPDLILADYNLPNGLNGLQLRGLLHKRLRRPVPVVILTGDISTETLRDIALHECTRLSKPVKAAELSEMIQRLLPEPRAASSDDAVAEQPIIYVVDDDDQARKAICSVLEEDGRQVRDYASCEAFLLDFDPKQEGCLLLDGYLPGMTGLELLTHLEQSGQHPPTIMITGNSDVQMAVAAMKAGVADFIEKPVSVGDLLRAIDAAVEHADDGNKLAAWREAAAQSLEGLTARQRDITSRVLAGHPSKNIAADLGISQRTVENHRASIMRRTGAKSLPALARLAVAAGWVGFDAIAEPEPTPGDAPPRPTTPSAH